ncbi:hypothetical protein RSAG8_13073, partial [Rhizoctonia solani AG-8 WAC10335]
MRSFKGHESRVTSVAFSPDGSRVVSGSFDCTVRLWDLSSGATIFTLHGHASTAIRFTPNGSYIVSVSKDCSTRIWNTSDGSLIRQSEMAHSNKISSIAVSPNGGRIVTASDCYICVWDTQSGKLIAGPFEGHTEWVTSVGFSGDGVRVVSASFDKTVRVWNAQGQIQPEKDSQETHGETFISTSRSQTHVALHFCLAFKAPKFEFHVWNLQTMTRVVISTGAVIEHLWFSLDGARIYSLHPPSTICTWDTQTAELLDGPHRFTALEKWDSLEYSVDGTRVVTCHGSKAELWHVKTNRSIAVCETGSGRNVRATFSRDGSRFVTYDSSVSEVWDGDSGARVAGPFPVKLFALSPDGTYLCCQSQDRSNQLINVNTGEQIDMPQGDYQNMMFTPDGDHVIGQNWRSNTIDIWNTRNQTVMAGFCSPTDMKGKGAVIMSGGSTSITLILPRTMGGS